MRAIAGWALLAAVWATPSAAGPAAPPLSGLFSRLEPGLWDLRSREPGVPSRRLCVQDFQALLQLGHPGQGCRRFVVTDRADRGSITYVCPRTGHGRTDIRLETAHLLQLDSQGVAAGRPFAISMEGRRVGACPPARVR